MVVISSIIPWALLIASALANPLPDTDTTDVASSVDATDATAAVDTTSAVDAVDLTDMDDVLETANADYVRPLPLDTRVPR